MVNACEARIEYAGGSQSADAECAKMRRAMSVQLCAKGGNFIKRLLCSFIFRAEKKIYKDSKNSKIFLLHNILQRTNIKRLIIIFELFPTILTDGVTGLYYYLIKRCYKTQQE